MSNGRNEDQPCESLSPYNTTPYTLCINNITNDMFI